LSTLFNVNMAKHTRGQSAQADNFHQATSWPNERKSFAVAGPSSPLWSHLFDLCSISWHARSSNLSQWPVPTTSQQSQPLRNSGLSILKSAPVDGDLILVNQDLAGFFTSIEQDRFVGAWFMLLDFLRPNMTVSDNEAFSVYPGKSTKTS
jgi:hypothetical protein